MDRNIDRILQNFTLGDNLIQDHLSEVAQIVQTNIITLVISLVVGLLLCFFGLKLIKLWSALAGLMVGIMIGLIVGAMIGLSGIKILMLVLFAGLLMLVLSVIFRRLGMFWVCLFAGGSIGVTAIYISPLIGLIIMLAVGLLAAILGAIVRDPIVIIMTAIQGSIASATAVAGMIDSDNYVLGIAIGGVLVVLGMVVQFMSKSREIGKNQSTWAQSVKEEQSREAEVEAARSIFVGEDADE